MCRLCVLWGAFSMVLMHETNLNLVSSESGVPPSSCSQGAHPFFTIIPYARTKTLDCLRQEFLGQLKERAGI